MSGRSRAATDLAFRLHDRLGIRITIGWDRPAGPRPGAWLIEWTDGPTVATVRALAADLVHSCRPLTTDALRFTRMHSIHATAAALLTLAARGELPPRPATATLMAEHELIDTDTATWAHLWTQAEELTRQAHGDIYEIVALAHTTTVAKPSNETPHNEPPSNETLRSEIPTGACQHCATELPNSNPGRPARFCGPACRQAAHRAAHTVTKTRNETTCAACGARFIPNPTGRPARHCSPTCRTRTWRRGGTRQP